MKVEFDGSFADIMADIVTVLNNMGLQVVPFAPPQAQAASQPSPAPEPQPAPEAPKKARGRPRKEEPVEANESVPQAEEDPFSKAEPEAMDAVALLKLKQDTLKRLRDLYVAGKGTLVRELLHKHGHGANVFPEVEAIYFPAIVADLERGLQ